MAPRGGYAVRWRPRLPSLQRSLRVFASRSAQSCSSGVSAPAIGVWIPVFLAMGILVALSAVAALRVRGKARVIWLAAAAGALYGLGDALTKSTVDLFSDIGWTTLVQWEPYALAATGIVSALFGQSAFGAGALSLSLPVIDTLEP